MKINGKISILVDQNKTVITVYDEDSRSAFLKVELTPEQLSTALSRLHKTDCESVEVYNLDRIGKVMEHKWLELPLIDKSMSTNRVALVKYFNDELDKLNEGWVLDDYFGSRDSFFERDGQSWAKTTIRRWV